MNAGAEILDTRWLLFLHADCRIPGDTRLALRRWLARPPQAEAGFFRFGLLEPRWYRTILERGQGARERLTGFAYGDQGLLISRRRFLEVGGFPDLALMEDVEMIRRLRRRGGIERIEAPLPTSGRRYDEAGPIRGWLRNATILTLYLLGVSPDALARWYRPRRIGVGSGTGSAPVGFEERR